ncbi:MAG: hypothetical protein K9K62_03615 [Desulfobacteraceae bacterium]|nr:hypothetical protein [Desulfobacteraceae bacterium]
MKEQQYYRKVIDRLKNCYQFSHHFIATGEALAAETRDPIFPAVAAEMEQLEEFTVTRGLEVHLPVVGERSQAVLMPLDIEIFLGADQHRLYTDKEEQKQLFQQVRPLMDFVQDIFRSRGMPYLLDYTPSGGHFLFQNVLGYRATEEVRGIGFVEEDLVRACNYIDPGDIRRWHGVSIDAARVFSGLGRLAEYLALLAMKAFRDNEDRGLLPVTISDSAGHCVNFDNTWSEGPPYLRAIRSPFSLHKKNREKYDNRHQPPLADVIGACFDGHQATETGDIDLILDCMWDLEKAAAHAHNFSGFIPCSNETMIDFVREYKASDLYAFHQDFDRQQDLARGRAVESAKNEPHIPDWTREILDSPNPSALQPAKLIGFVHDFLIHAGWQPKHIANILRDLYQNPDFNWTQDFFKHPAEEKANFWARTYSAVALWKTGRLHI